MNFSTQPQNSQTTPAIAPLGKSTKSVSFKTESEFSTFDNFKIRLELQSHARTLIPNSRVRICLRHLRPDSDTVEIHTGAGGAKYGGLMACDNIWLCPVCSSKKWASRGAVLSDALKTAKKLNFFFYMFTFTVSHNQSDELKPLITDLIKSYRGFWGGAWGQKLKKHIGYIGSIRALEIRANYESGWHPHYHVLMVTESPLPEWIEIRGRGRGAKTETIPLHDHLKSRWVAMLAKAGRVANTSHGLDIREGGAVLGEYITKQSNLHFEVTRGLEKTSKVSYSPLELLKMSHEGDSKAGFLWQEYAFATKGFKALQYSHDLMQILGVDSIEGDSEPATDTSELYAKIPPHIWHAIKQHNKDIRGRILTIATFEPVYHLAVYLSHTLNIPFEVVTAIYPHATPAPRNKIRYFVFLF